jgi:hypothetical protein
MVKVKLESMSETRQMLEVMAWCEEMFGFSKYDELGRWTAGRWCLETTRGWTFKFANSNDAVLFKLRWA